jgi:hypothetical protein
VNEGGDTSYHPKGDLIPRAIAAYFIRGDGTVFPHSSAVVEHDGLRYVMLFDHSDAVLAAYRVRPDTGALRRLKRWPAEVEQKGRAA